MANTGNTQQQIDYGAAANDGQGDPLRTAFIKTDDNFDNIWLAGPVGSNITIVNNTLQSNNTNGNIVLRPNGVGVVQANAAIVPNATNLRDLGTADLRFRAAYVGTGGLSVDGNIAADYVVVNTDLTVNGNLIVEGDVIQIGNIVTDSLTIQLANTATTDAQANGSGITVGANDDVATLLYNSTDNEWRTNIGANIAGNVGANYFIGNGSLLTGIASTYGNANVADFLADFGSNNISTSGNISAPGGVGGNGQVVYNYAGVLTVAPSNFNFDQDTQTLFLTSLSVAGNSNTGRDAVYIGVPGVTSLGPDTLLQATANFDSYAQINMQNLSAAAEASGDFIITADNGTDDTHYINLGMAGSGWNGDQPNSLGDNVNANDGFLYVQDGDLVIGIKQGVSNVFVWSFTDQGISGAGNVTANYFIGDGSLLTGISTYGNANVVGLLANFGSNTITTTGNITGDFVAPGGNGQVLYNRNGVIGASPFNFNFDESTFTLFLKSAAVAGNTDNGRDAIYAGVPGVTPLGSDVIVQAYGNFAAYSQINMENISDSPEASGDFIITADNGTDTTHFVNLGMASSNWDGTQPNSLGANVGPNDGYLYTQDGNLVVGVKSGISDMYLWRFTDQGITGTGNVTANSFIGDGSQLTGVASTGNITFTDTTVSPPDGVDITISAANSEVIIEAFDIRLDATDDLRLIGNDIVSLRNRSTTDPVTIITDYDDSETTWTFAVDGTLTTPGDIVVAGDVTGTAGASTLVLKAQPASNTSIQLNSIVDSVISTVANLEIRTDVSNTAKTWEFDTTGDFTAPGNITANYFLGNGSQLTDVNAVTVDVTDTNGLTTIYYPTFVENRTTGQIARADVDLTYRTDDNVLTVGNISVTGNITGNTAGFAIGYRDIPQVSFTGNATIAATDAGKHFYSTQSTDYILTIANNASQGFQTGAAITVVNQGTGNITVAQGSGVTLYLAGNATSGNRTVSTFGMATIMKVATDTWFINGTGVS